MARDCQPIIVISQEGDTDNVTVISLTSGRENTLFSTHVLTSEQDLDHAILTLAKLSVAVNGAQYNLFKVPRPSYE